MQLTRADGRKMRLLREEADLTVDELVFALEELEGITRHPDTIRNIELGRKSCGFKLLNAIARVLGVPRDALLADEAAQSPNATDEAVRVRNVERSGSDALPELPDKVLRTGA